MRILLQSGSNDVKVTWEIYHSVRFVEITWREGEDNNQGESEPVICGLEHIMIVSIDGRAD